MSAVSYSQLLSLAAPETILVLTVLAVLGADFLALRGLELRFRLIIGGMISALGCVGAAAWMLLLPAQADFLHGMFVVDPLVQLVKVALLVLTFFTILLSLDTDFTEHVGEYFALILLATLGMMFLVSTEDVLMVFISLELTSLSLYILTAFNKRNVKSAEAALKYFLFGGMAAAFTLFGLSLLYGIAGSTNLSDIAHAVAQKAVYVVVANDGSLRQVVDPVLAGAIVMTVIGFGFKVAAVPFHLWAPDAYQGAPVPSAALIASGSKVASFFIFAKVLVLGFHGAEGSGFWHAYMPGWMPVLAVVAAASMFLGNLVAIVQSSVRRLLAYSAIAHAGYMLLAVLTHTQQSVASLVYYAVTYGLTTLGAFGVVLAVQERGGGENLTDFAGLSRRAPLVSFCMLVFMLSLAGIPPLAGFFGKFYVFTAALGADPKHLGLLWLVILAVAMSAVSLYYYLQVLKQIYVVDVPAGASSLRAPVSLQVALALLALAVIVLGCCPQLLLGRLVEAVQVASTVMR
jgi:NADH-quinone oxidoreductase subunit N